LLSQLEFRTHHKETFLLDFFLLRREKAPQ